jgi:hypothetical protein
MNATQKAKLKETESIIKQNDSIKNASIIIPENFGKIISIANVNKNTLRPTVYIHYNNKDITNYFSDCQNILKATNWIVPKTELVAIK